ncbi:DegT/DnrJ/EryC1/StrS aminotransferase family protein [Bradyrhizobium arachidis]|uniref:DegT/DnrJ/EryC1/StrS family aminotransferase n=1 Tax=Bradyrhizobium arachidis TaxID=858423 RepID=UPI002161AA81|nr:DegT/DnrJ/EryC1/StrS family aminotransferase [Bradyrhizobium arachidis]UVO30158.1 DegT/DnrJ/EryC1/StrS family aminotransferase [Bradyrhizobium arachidis]
MLALHGGPAVLSQPGPHFVWPVITEQTRQAVNHQLDRTVSIYDRSGIFKEFEDDFARYQGAQYALVTNSGTSALFGIYEGLGLGPEDEVICADYSFFATSGPLIYLGVRPVFCDVDQNGNLDPDDLALLVSPRTRAVVVTHMWGVPCEMDRIGEICARNGIALIEDCSHAHGARFKGRLVGTFGVASAWSLQAQKLVTGGEGGIITTSDQEIYVRAQLQGQYNKRCREEIDKDHPLYGYALTGFGLKLRAHPLAIAMAAEQFGNLDRWIAQKSEFAARFDTALGEYEFISIPRTQDTSPSWYAYTFRFDPAIAGIDRDLFVKALYAEGLREIDIPNSMRPVSDLALFSDPGRAMPRLRHFAAPEGRMNRSNPKSREYWASAIKLPVWAFPEDDGLVGKYIEGLTKVCDAIRAGQLRN